MQTETIEYQAGALSLRGFMAYDDTRSDPRPGVLVMPGAPGTVDGYMGDHIAISPPFTISEDEVRETVRVVSECVAEAASRLT